MHVCSEPQLSGDPRGLGFCLGNAGCRLGLTELRDLKEPGQTGHRPGWRSRHGGGGQCVSS